ncbi:hypothetical protein M9H77_36496 [Catharanthus roseus]|uniref:Uncharacterized protein n=1 Tax=Catharanthus roseus TaxID=4058 RepID=A0ACB9ZT95_CATRO|nr:hypothetical protein M9H77_36496 [Catharanthus roseus]
MPVKNSHPFHEGGYQGRPQVRGGRRGGLGGRGNHRPQKEFPGYEVAFKDHSKPKVEEKGNLITNPTRCFKCDGVGHIEINRPTKRTLVFNGDLNSWIEKSDDYCQDTLKSKIEELDGQGKPPKLFTMCSIV